MFPVACCKSVLAGVLVKDLDVYLQSYNADESQLKKAYYAIMRECHPDLSQDEESSEYSTVINEIYEVLTVLAVEDPQTPRETSSI